MDQVVSFVLMYLTTVSCVIELVAALALIVCTSTMEPIATCVGMYGRTVILVTEVNV